MPSRAAAPVVDESCCGPILRTFELYQDCADAAGLYSEVLAGSASASADPARELESLVSLCALLKEERMEAKRGAALRNFARGLCASLPTDGAKSRCDVSAARRLLRAAYRCYPRSSQFALHACAHHGTAPDVRRLYQDDELAAQLEPAGLPARAVLLERAFGILRAVTTAAAAAAAEVAAAKAAAAAATAAMAASAGAETGAHDSARSTPMGLDGVEGGAEQAPAVAAAPAGAAAPSRMSTLSVEPPSRAQSSRMSTSSVEPPTPSRAQSSEPPLPPLPEEGAAEAALVAYCEQAFPAAGRKRQRLGGGGGGQKLPTPRSQPSPSRPLSQPRPQLPGCAHRPSDVSAASLLAGTGAVLSVTVPHGVAPGQSLQLSTPMGLMRVVVPPGCGPGSVFGVRPPPSPLLPPPAASAMQAARTSESAPPRPVPPAQAATGSAGSAGMGPPPGDSTWSFGNGVVEDVD